MGDNDHDDDDDDDFVMLREPRLEHLDASFIHLTVVVAYSRSRGGGAAR